MLSVEGKLVPTVMYVSPDITGVILGIDWLSQPGNLWDFGGRRIKIGDGDWIPLGSHSGPACNRIYAETDVVLPPRQETTVNARMTWRGPRDLPEVTVNETIKIPYLSRFYCGRTLLPARHGDLQIRVLNADPREQVITKGTCLGTALPVTNIIDDIPDTVADTGPLETNPVEKLIDGLPDDLTDEQRTQAESLIRKHEPIFSRHEYDIGRTPWVEHRIDTGDHRPIRQPLRRHPFEHLEQIDRQVEEMARNGIVEPASSPWASNVVLVKKKDGTLRFCVDYRQLNAITVKDSYPLPLIDNCLNALAGAEWFSTIDLRAGYHNIPIAEQDRDKSAFVTRRGCFRYTVMPFGMTTSPSVFQRLMDCVLAGLSYITCLVYLDDVIIFGRTFDEQLTRLDEVFCRIRRANLKLKPTKCSLFQREVEFLGHLVSADGVAMQPGKLEAIRSWPPCRNVTEVRAFLGTCGYYRRFIQGFADLAVPLYDLLKKNEPFRWTGRCQQAFEALKERLMTEPVLALPSDNGQFVLDTDASDQGLGAVLSDRGPTGEERVIAYASRRLQTSELNYETTRKELLAVVYGLKQFRQYLHGRHIVIRTDHAALSWLRRTPEPMPQMARWLSFIEEFDYEVQHRAGRQHGNADGLSRRPEPRDAENEGADMSDDADRVTNLKTEGEVAALVKESGHNDGETADPLDGEDEPQSETSAQVSGRL